MTAPDLDAARAMLEGVTGSAREWSEPYTLVNMGTWFMLKAHGIPVASYDVGRWGSEEACIEAAWQRAYGMDDDRDRDLLIAEVEVLRAANRGLVRLNEATEARAIKAEATIAALEARVEAMRVAEWNKAVTASAQMAGLWSVPEDGPDMSEAEARAFADGKLHAIEMVRKLLKPALPLPSDTAPGDIPGLRASQPGEASVSSAPAHDPVAEAARALLADDIAISKMAQAIHDGPLGADDEWFSASSPQGAWCIDAVRAALRALAQENPHE